MKKFCIPMVALAILALPAAAQEYLNDFSDSNQKLETIGRGDCNVSGGVFSSESSYALFGEPGWKDYRMTFRARAPKDADQVQIWAGFRASNRFDRYAVGIKGGLQDDIYLMRLGYMGTDEFMAVRPLGFHPECGEWYTLTIEVCGSRIRVFVGDEPKPYIDLVDKNSELAPAGPVTLGGGWIRTEFDDLKVVPLAPDALADTPVEEYAKRLTPEQKETARAAARKGYGPVQLSGLDGSRTELSLDGDWLFMPDYQSIEKDDAISADADDSSWHVMQVPNFWNPIRIWLHGETMGSPTGHQPKGVSDTYYQMETDRCESYTFEYRRIKSAWYRQWVELPGAVAGKRVSLHFDAVSKIAEVYVNGVQAGSHVGMFGEFDLDISDLVKPGKNLVAVKVVKDYLRNIEDPDKVVDVAVTVPVTNKMLRDLAHGFYGDDPAGIWQPVKMVITDKLKVDDAYIKPALDGADFEITVSNSGSVKNNFDIVTDIVDKSSGSILASFNADLKATLAPGACQTYQFNIHGLKPYLWSPQHPHLYDFTFRIVDRRGGEKDRLTVTSGFRTFEVKDGLFELNGVPYWLRGGNHTPFALAPNDRMLADTFFHWMREGNIEVTRTHTTPWNDLWLTAADEDGIGVSFEGSWPWLMIQSSPIPDQTVLKLWEDEFISLLKKYRNHPSVLIWTVNNEMKFYDNDNDIERAKKKMRIISDVVGRMRETDPTRPICFDSNYQAKGKDKKFGKDFMDTIDDGDIDDVHGYYNWYDYSLFRFFNGEFQERFKMPDRPLISQEMSTGYPNNETGHPTRSYQLIHQNPYCLVGYNAYDFCDPKYFLEAQSFITGELAEVLRRSDDRASGILHFALLTWFRQSYDYRNIEPYPTYYALKRALQPVLVSAELWGRNLYAGERIPTRICVVNDLEDGRTLRPTLLRWELKDAGGNTFASGRCDVPEVAHYSRMWIEPEIVIPNSLPAARTDAKLCLTLSEDGITVSRNEYDLTLADRSWCGAAALQDKSIRLLDYAGFGSVLDQMGIAHEDAASVDGLTAGKADVCIIAGEASLSAADCSALREWQRKGGKLILLGGKQTAKDLYPEYITSWIIPTEGDICNMERDDAPVFDGLDVLDLRYFNNNLREIPLVCTATLKTVRDPRLTELAGQMKIHAYIDGGKPEDRIRKIESMRGLTMLTIDDGEGQGMVSTICVEKAATDPIAGKLLVNMIKTIAE